MPTDVEAHVLAISKHYTLTRHGKTTTRDFCNTYAISKPPILKLLSFLIFPESDPLKGRT